MSGEWRVSDAIGILGIKDGSWERLYEIETLSSVVFEAHLTTGESKYDKSKYRPIIENGDPTEGPTPEAIRGGGESSARSCLAPVAGRMASGLVLGHPSHDVRRRYGRSIPGGQ